MKSKLMGITIVIVWVSTRNCNLDRGHPLLMSPAAGIGTVSPRRTVTGVWCQSAPV